MGFNVIIAQCQQNSNIFFCLSIVYLNCSVARFFFNCLILVTAFLFLRKEPDVWPKTFRVLIELLNSAALLAAIIYLE